MTSLAPVIDELAIDAHAAEIRRASEWLSTACRGHAVPDSSADRLVLCLNEALANVILHGGVAVRGHPIRLRLEVGSEPACDTAAVTVVDAGPAFDPTRAPEQPAARTLEEAVAGGRGIRMMRRCSDWLHYRREGAHNHLTFGARWAREAHAPRHYGRGPDRRKGQAGFAGPDRRRAERRGEALDWIGLFRDADRRELEQALAECEVLRLPAGTPLLRRGEPNRNVYILLSGRLIAQLGDEVDSATAIDIAPGDCIGELSAIDGKSISALVLSVTDVRVLRLDRDVFWGRIMLLKGVAANLMATLTERMRRSNEKALALQRERLELKHLRKELEVARQLQASMLPLQRPLFPWRDDVEVCGFMEPASKVGGDLFDVLFVDDHTLFVCTGDVSGHGIAAALFMVRVIGLLRTLAMDSVEPDKILETLNDRLCIGNDTNLFVTVFCGFLDVRDGRFVYANGGHCTPLILSAGRARRLAAPRGMLVGAASGRHYARAECHLGIGETLFCYSDGVSEACDAAGRQFSEQGCIDWLQQGDKLALAELLDSLFERVVQHAGSPMLADDCTMLAVRRLAPPD